MNIRKYAASSIDNATEIAQLLTKKEVINLAGEVGAMGLVTWTEGQIDHDAMIFDFVSARAYNEIKYTQVSDWPDCFADICDDPF